MKSENETTETKLQIVSDSDAQRISHQSSKFGKVFEITHERIEGRKPQKDGNTLSFTWERETEEKEEEEGYENEHRKKHRNCKIR